MHTKRRSSPGRWIAAAGLLLTLAGCATTVAGTPVAEQGAHAANSGAAAASTSGAAPKTGTKSSPGQDAEAAAHAVMRKVDPCALHSPEAAAKVTGMQPDEIMPGTSLNACDVELTPGPLELTAWTLTATVGVDLDEGRRQEATQEQIADIAFFKLPALGGAADDRSCSYVMGFGTDTGIELRVRRSSTEAQPKTPCQVATAYLAEVGKYWKEPATRSDKVTSPTLRIADVDPCAGLDALSDALGGPIRTRTSDPYSCTVSPATPGAKPGLGGLVTTEVGIDTDPRALVGNPAAKDYKAMTVAGKPGVASEMRGAKGNTCSLTVIADEDVALQADQSKPDAQKSYQVVETRAENCDLASKAAEVLLASLR
jgi:hypothetical protein